MKLKDWWWEDNDLHCITDTDEKYVLKNAYLSSFKIDGIEATESNEMITHLSARYSCEERTSEN